MISLDSALTALKYSIEGSEYPFWTASMYICILIASFGKSSNMKRLILGYVLASWMKLAKKGRSDSETESMEYLKLVPCFTIKDSVQP